MRKHAGVPLLASLLLLASISLPTGTHAQVGHRLPPIRFTPASLPVGDLHALGSYIADSTPSWPNPPLNASGGLGVDWVREEFRADHLHGSARRPYYFPRYDAVVQRERAAGLHILGLLDYNNTFNHRDHVWMGHDWLVSLTTDFIRYVTAVVTHYRHVIRYWQIWNEPDIEERWRPHPSASDYAYLLRRTYSAIKNIDPKDKVVIAGPTTGNDAYAAQFVQAVHRDHGPFDIAAFQPYSFRPGPQVFSDVATLKRLRKPVWFSEIGWGGEQGCVPCGSPYDQANLLSAIYLIAAVSGVQRCFWYEFRDGGVGPQYSQHFGLVAHDFRGKPAYRAYALGRYLMDGSMFIGWAQLGPSVWLYRFRRSNHVFYEMWNVYGAPQPLDIGWAQKFVNVDTSALRHLTATYSNHLRFTMEPYSVDYLIPPSLKIKWTRSLPVPWVVGR